MITEGRVMTNEPSTRLRYDADSHLMERPDWLSSYADPGIRERLDDLCPRSLKDQMRELLGIAELRKDEPVLRQWAEADPFAVKSWAALGAVFPEERSRALDLMGFGAQLVFSTYSINQFILAADPEVRNGGARAHNRGIVEFCAADKRLLPVAVVPLEDGDTAAQLVAEAIEAGCAAVWIPPITPTRISPSHVELDPFWARLQDADIPFVLHVGTSGGQVDPVYHNNGRPLSPDLFGGDENMRSKDYMALPELPAKILTALILDGVLDRFPSLRGGCIEYGAAWVPAWLDRLDRTHKYFSSTESSLADLREKPSRYVREQLKFTPDSSEQVALLMEQLGDELLMFSTDFPHPEGGKDPIGSFELALATVSEERKDLFYRKNFAQLMGSQE
ncbi:MAG: hydrolase [Actinobacteria bacterium]|nr:MAG: hydrolase [Actinomycetota bacterium]